MNPPKPAATPKPAPGANSSADHLDKPKQIGTQPPVTKLPVTKEELKDLANDAEGG